MARPSRARPVSLTSLGLLCCGLLDCTRPPDQQAPAPGLGGQPAGTAGGDPFGGAAGWGGRHSANHASSGGKESAGGAAAEGSGGASSTGGDATGSGGDSADGGHTASGGALVSSPVNGCVSFVPRMASTDDRELLWNFDLVFDEERCLQIAVGQSVTWSGNFAFHPLSPYDGDTPNPITLPEGSVEQHSVVFPHPGTFGYVCEAHTEMRGAVRVVVE